MLATETDVTVHRELLDRLLDARHRTDELFAIVRPDSLYDRPIPERHRIIFYIGHLETFDWNLLSDLPFGLKSFHPDYDKLFAFGIDPVGGGLPGSGLPNDQPSDWPTLAQVREYATRSRQILDNALRNETPRRDLEFPLTTLLNVAIEHRLMHAETLAYMLHQLPHDKKIPQQDRPAETTSPVVPRMIEIPAGPATLGLPRSSDAFGWDNEFEALTVDVPAFSIDQYEITNREYLDFVEAGGYTNRELWTPEDWHWKSTNNISHPAFWTRSEGCWLYRGMFAEIPLPLDAPVYTSLAEARAYSRWAGKDLPTEAEWHRAAYAETNGAQRAYPWGGKFRAGAGNFDFTHWDPTPVNAFPAGNSALGVSDLLGNGWEWTSTPFAPLPGFEPFPFYRGYSADFFDNKHFVLKGGSVRTAACMLRLSFRNWFQSHYQYVYAGFRCVLRY